MRASRIRWARVFVLAATIALVVGLAGPHLSADPPQQDSELKTPPARKSAKIDFARDIRPILAEACYQCHGPDAKQRDSDLRLDVKQSAFGEREGRRAIAPGDLEASELIRRITSSDGDLRMPPVDSALRLSPAQVATLKQWIRQGASWSEHWSFTPPARSSPPSLQSDSAGLRWRRNAIDNFVWRRLRAEDLQPQEQASREALIRRVSLSLTGLPPSLAEIDAFLADRSPQAYERLVDRLLESPHYGEQMALGWLDAARYADTSGYQNDGPRSMWRWRDWVIEAFNDNMPFDQFTIHQLAGDLLDAPPKSEAAANDYESAWRGKLIRDPERLNHLIASAFNRNHRGNAEGGIIAEEYQVEYVVDRVDTTATVWLGLTIGCARCHDHKFDPIEQREFYGMFAFFNNVPEFGRAVKEGNSPPFIKAPTRAQQNQLRQIEAKIKKARSAIKQDAAKLVQQQRTWESKFDGNEEPATAEVLVRDRLLARFAFDGQVKGESEYREVKLEAKPSPDSAAMFVEGRIGKAIHLQGKSHLDAGDIANFSYFDKFSLTAWVNPQQATGTIVSRMTPEDKADGYAIQLVDGRVQVNLVKRWLDDSIRVESKVKLPLNHWTHVAMVYDGSREPTAIRVYLNGQSIELAVKQDFINQTFAAKDQPVRIGGGSRPFSGRLDDVRIYSRALSERDVAIVSTPDTIASLISIKPQQRSQGQSTKLREHFLQYQASAELKSQRKRLHDLQAARKQLLESIPTLMVMQEMQSPRETHILLRGQYDKPGEPAPPGLPKALVRNKKQKSPRNRLEFARWLVDRQNPLTARVAVNRIWQQHFGIGLVETAEDFGVQGSPPSHPQLLDWLATQLMDSGWNLKELHKLIVMSATFRQSSSIAAELRVRDPHNRLLARGARFRLSAEAVRDQMLAISGLLTRKLGGPSVRPYQPEGLWKEIATDTNYEQSHGEDLYRRSIYTYWKRTVAPPTMSTLDAPPRESCTVKRSRTNTPLQALVLMNETSFVEAARVLAERTLRSGGESDASKLQYIFRTATARRLTSRESEILIGALHRFRKQFQADPKSAAKLIRVGEHPRDKRLETVDVAAYTMVASLVLNLDEVINRE